MKSRATGGTLTIGEVAGRFGLATSVLRHWDTTGVLRPSFRVSGRRRYAENDVYRVAIVLFCKEAGLSLPEIRELLSTRRSKRRRAMLQRKATELDARIAQAQAARRMVQEAMYCQAPDPVTCPYFRAAIAVHGLGGD